MARRAAALAFSGVGGNPELQTYRPGTLDGYVKTIGPTTTAFTHYWRIVATLENGKTEVFWGHTKSLAEAKRKTAAAGEASKMRGWRGFALDIVEVVASEG